LTKKFSKRILWIVALGAVLVWVYPPLTFHGDGRMSGVPIIGYWIRFRPVPFYQPGEYVFHFRGTPNDEMTLQLHVKGKTGKDEAELTQLGTTLQAVLVDQKGRVICQVGGTPKLEPGKRSDNNPNYWILTTPDGDAAYYHWNCAGVRLHRIDSYTLTIRIQDVDPKTPKTDLIPVLEGSHPDMI
jgi:hypothetical protein